MNISSIVIRVLPEFCETLVGVLKSSKVCDYFVHDDTKIIVTIEGVDISEEIGKLKMIQKMEHVLAADMMYSYSEDELEKEKDKIEKSGDVNQWLNDSSENAGLIRYAGDLKKKM
jgi:nitrate reductase NapD